MRMRPSLRRRSLRSGWRGSPSWSYWRPPFRLSVGGRSPTISLNVGAAGAGRGGGRREGGAARPAPDAECGAADVGGCGRAGSDRRLRGGTALSEPVVLIEGTHRSTYVL